MSVQMLRPKPGHRVEARASSLLPDHVVHHHYLSAIDDHDDGVQGLTLGSLYAAELIRPSQETDYISNHNHNFLDLPRSFAIRFMDTSWTI